MMPAMPRTPPKPGTLRSRRKLATTLQAPTRATAPKLQSTGGTEYGSTIAKPKAGFDFVQKSGPRAGLSYKVVTGDSGLTQRVYENGDTADTAATREARKKPLARRALAGRLKAS